MITYPSIIHYPKSPKKECIAFDKLDGSNVRFRYCPKNGFVEFGTRTQIISEETDFWNEIIDIFKSKYENILLDKFRKDSNFNKFKSIVLFGEFLGENSFAGQHVSEPHDITFFDVMNFKKQWKFLKPQNFIEDFSCFVPTPRVVYKGVLTDDFIADVQNNKFSTKEGVICKGVETNGAFSGHVWSCKIKTIEYLTKIKSRFGDEWELYS